MARLTEELAQCGTVKAEINDNRITIEEDEKVSAALWRKTKDSGDDFRRGFFTETGKVGPRLLERLIAKKAKLD